MKNTLLSPSLENYCREHSSPDDPSLDTVVRYTHTQTQHPQMLSGPWQGTFLQMISEMINPKYIVEIGTFTGYSAIRLARGLAPGGKLITIESHAERLHNTKVLLQEFPELPQITFIEGKALEVLPDLDDGIDLAFIDAKKDEYQAYYQTVIPKMRPGGVILIDNILWYGKVMKDDRDPTTDHLHQLNKIVTEDPRVSNCLMPLRDGVMMIRVRV